MNNFCWELFNKINQTLSTSQIKKGRVAKELNISKTAFSNQLKNLKIGKGINVLTLKKIEDLTGQKFFNI